MKTFVRRLEHLEDILGHEPPPAELSPALQEAVDKIVRRES